MLGWRHGSPSPILRFLFYPGKRKGSDQAILLGNLMLGDEHVVFWSKEIVGRAFFMTAFLVKRATLTQASCFSKHPSLRHGGGIALAVRPVDMAVLLSRMHTQDFS